MPSTVDAAIKAADHVLVFSGDLGHYGGTASLISSKKFALFVRSILMLRSAGMVVSVLITPIHLLRVESMCLIQAVLLLRRRIPLLFMLPLVKIKQAQIPFSE